MLGCVTSNSMVQCHILAEFVVLERGGCDPPGLQMI